MKKENVIKTIAASLSFFVIYFIVTNLVGLSINLYCYLTYSELRTADYEAYTRQAQTFMQENILYRGLFQFILFIVVLLIIFKVRRTSLLTRIRWNPVSKQTYALVAVMAISNIIALNFLLYFLLPQNLVQGAEEYSALIINGGLFMNIILTLIIGPFSEELLMRGLMASRLMGRLPLWFVVALPTILFGIGHAAGGMGQIIGTTITGLVFTLVFIWTNSLRTAVLAHILNNLLAAFLPWSAIKDGMNTPIQLMVGIACFIITIFVGYIIYKKWDKTSVVG